MKTSKLALIIILSQVLIIACSPQKSSDSANETPADSSIIEIDEQIYTPTTEPKEQVVEKEIESSSELENPIRGTIVNAFDTGQGPMYNVIINSDGKEIKFWVEATDEIFKWSQSPGEYSDTEIIVNYRENILLRANSISAIDDSSSTGKGIGILKSVDDHGDTPGGLALENSEGTMDYFEGNFSIESSEDTKELIGQLVKVEYIDESEKWMLDFEYVESESTNGSESPFLGKWILTEGSKHPVSGDLVKSTLTVTEEEGEFIIEWDTELGFPATIYAQLDEFGKTLVGDHMGQGNVSLELNGSNISFSVDPFAEFEPIKNDIYSKD